MLIEQRKPDGSYQCWDFERYAALRRIKELSSDQPDTCVDHPLVGKAVQQGDRIIHIESVHKHWFCGYYLMCVYRIDGTRSHGTAVIENINSIDCTIVELADEWAAIAKEQ